MSAPTPTRRETDQFIAGLFTGVILCLGMACIAAWFFS